MLVPATDLRCWLTLDPAGTGQVQSKQWRRPHSRESWWRVGRVSETTIFRHSPIIGLSYGARRAPRRRIRLVVSPGPQVIPKSVAPCVPPSTHGWHPPAGARLVPHRAATLAAGARADGRARPQRAAARLSRPRGDARRAEGNARGACEGGARAAAASHPARESRRRCAPRRIEGGRVPQGRAGVGGACDALSAAHSATSALVFSRARRTSRVGVGVQCEIKVLRGDTRPGPSTRDASERHNAQHCFKLIILGRGQLFQCCHFNGYAENTTAATEGGAGVLEARCFRDERQQIGSTATTATFSAVGLR